MKKGGEDMLALEIDAAVKNLLNYANENKDIQSEFDMDAAKLIIENCHCMPDSAGKDKYKQNMEITVNKGGVSTGHTEEAGNITVQDDREKVDYKETIEGYLETKLGHYKFYRYYNCIYFRYFWATDIITVSLNSFPQEYYLVYNEDTLQPEKFGLVILEAIDSIFCNIVINNILFIKNLFFYILSFGRERIYSEVNISRAIDQDIWTSDS